MRHLVAFGALFAVVLLTIPSSKAADFPLARPLGKQLLVSVSADWSSFHAVVYGFSRRNIQSPWVQDFSFPAVLGRNGLGWGLGVHGWVLDSGPVKHEGDKRSPAGLFYLPSTFGYEPAEKASPTNYPYLQLTDDILDVDDPLSPFYNRIVNRKSQDPRQWRSAEVMHRPDGAYRLGIFVAHNDPLFKNSSGTHSSNMPLPVPGSTALGSCIFIHIWKSENNPTIGCTAVSPENAQHLVHWLRQDDTPLFLQLPFAEYQRFQKIWGLPLIPSPF